MSKDRLLPGVRIVETGTGLDRLACRTNGPRKDRRREKANHDGSDKSRAAGYDCAGHRHNGVLIEP